jgi:hypothetical protein
MMKTAKITLVILFLLCGTITSYSQEKSTSTYQVNLKPGDEFIYLKSEKVKYITRFPKGAIIANSPGTDDSSSYDYIVENHIRRPDNSFPKEKYTLIGRYSIDNGTGLLRNLHYTSYIGDEDKIQTSKLYQSRSDIVDISETMN